MPKKPTLKTTTARASGSGDGDRIRRTAELFDFAWNAGKFIFSFAIPFGFTIGTLSFLYSWWVMLTPSEMIKGHVDTYMANMRNSHDKSLNETVGSIRAGMEDRNAKSESLLVDISNLQTRLQARSAVVEEMIETQKTKSAEILTNAAAVQETLNDRLTETRILTAKASQSVDAFLDELNKQVSANQNYVKVVENLGVTDELMVKTLADTLLNREEFRDKFWHVMAPEGTLFLADEDGNCPQTFVLLGNLKLFSEPKNNASQATGTKTITPDVGLNRGLCYKNRAVARAAAQ